MQRTLLALNIAAALALGNAAAQAGSSGGNFTRPNSDIRALEPPIDVTPDQLRAQQLPWGYQGRSVGYGQPPYGRPYGRPQ